MDSQESPSVHKQQQSQSPRSHGTIVAPPNPPPPQLYQQEQQQQPPHDHGEMEETLILPSSLSSPQRQNHQQEQTNSYTFPAKIIFHQPQQQKKRGRPKKSLEDGLSISPTLTSKASEASSSEYPSEKSHGRLLRSSKKKKQPQTLDSNASGDDFASLENLAKKLLKRSSFSIDKLKQKDLGVLGPGWMPHLIPISIGEDIVRKVMTFTEQGPAPRIVRIISASGVVSNVTLRKLSTGGGHGTVTYEGQFVIISLSGSLLLSESKGSLSITGDLSVSLSKTYNKVLSGVISGSLKAAFPVVLFSFILDKENPESKAPFSSLLPNGLNINALVTEVTSTSRGALSNLADENGDSPLNHE